LLRVPTPPSAALELRKVGPTPLSRLPATLDPAAADRSSVVMEAQQRHPPTARVQGPAMQLTLTVRSESMPARQSAVSVTMLQPVQPPQSCSHWAESLTIPLDTT
jgi:hypothetical protein